MVYALKTPVRISRLLLPALVCVFALVDAPAASASLTPELRCRIDIQKRSLRYVERSHRARQRCMRRVIRGRLVPSTNCIDGDGDRQLSKRLAELRARVRRVIPKRCTGIDLTLLGYPGECEDDTAAVFDPMDLEECIIQQHDRTIADLMRLEYPPTQFYPSKFAFCINGVARRAAQLVASEVRARYDCMLRGAISSLAPTGCREGIQPYGEGTGSPKTDQRVLRGYIQMLSGIPDACSGVSIDFLGYEDDCEDDTGGRFNTFDLKVCLFDSHREAVQEIVELAFPTPIACGDGVVAGDEECDDGNGESGDGCSESCVTEFCGDGAVNNVDEQCDDAGGNSDSGKCLTDCTVAVCGDAEECIAATCTSGPTGGSEDCDDGNVESGDGCSDVCAIEICGDGVVNNNGEECDDGAANGTGPNQCRLGACTLPVCGDGIVDDAEPYNEQCDPPSGSSCSADCKRAECGNGELDDGEQCDDGEGNSDTTPDACRTDCTDPVCGDGVNDGTEGCDNGEANSDSLSDACRTDCSLPTCGDGVIDAGRSEECDDGDDNSDTDSDACRTDCSLAACGDGVVDAELGEACDGEGGACDDDVPCSETCSCPSECPGSGSIRVYAGAGLECDTDAECGPGECIEGRCRTETRLDTGLTGLAHGSDITDGVTVRGFLECGTEFPCGECAVTGIDPSPGYCRCANDNRQVCFDKFQPDDESCGGEMCECFFGPPLSLSSGNTPACIVNRFRADVSGVADVDAGSGTISTSLGSLVFLGISTIAPCPSCEGDVTPDDGVRDGTCVAGRNDGMSCDANGINSSFPAPGGDGHSVDCMPSAGLNVSGASGILIDIEQTTGHAELGVTEEIECGFPPFIEGYCFCALCTGDPSIPCNTNEDCESVGAGLCDSFGGDRRPFTNNSCTDDAATCMDEGNGEGRCLTGPDDKFCDGILLANGNGFFQCNTNADCAKEAIGVDGGDCTLAVRRPCFLDPIVADGAADPQFPKGVATFCIPRVPSSPAINSVAGLPGPARVINQVESTLFCANDPTQQYTPGVGGCE